MATNNYTNPENQKPGPIGGPEAWFQMAEELPKEWPIEPISFTLARLKSLTKLLEDYVDGSQSSLSELDASAVACTVRGQVDLLEKLFSYGLSVEDNVKQS